MFERYQGITETRDQADQGGFTLIELLIVIAVLGILAAVTVFGLAGVGGQSLTAACHADAQSVLVAQEAYRAANQGSYDGATAPGPQLVDAAGMALVPAYLRTPPGNTNKYTIKTDTSGVITVTKVAGNLVGTWPQALPANDPCANL